jgi:hypothetical protein
MCAEVSEHGDTAEHQQGAESADHDALLSLRGALMWSVTSISAGAGASQFAWSRRFSDSLSVIVSIALAVLAGA